MMDNCNHEKTMTKEKIFKNGTKHLEKICCLCLRHLAFISHVADHDFIMPFGKYKDKRLEEVIKDQSYCDYILTLDIGNNIKTRIRNLLTLASDSQQA